MLDLQFNALLRPAAVQIPLSRPAPANNKPQLATFPNAPDSFARANAFDPNHFFPDVRDLSTQGIINTWADGKSTADLYGPGGYLHPNNEVNSEGILNFVDNASDVFQVGGSNQNVTRVLMTDSTDIVNLNDGGWTKTEHVVDKQMLALYQMRNILPPDQRLPDGISPDGTLYTDERGNQILVVGKGQVNITANAPPDPPPGS